MDAVAAQAIGGKTGVEVHEVIESPNGMIFKPAGRRIEPVSGVRCASCANVVPIPRSRRISAILFIVL